MPITCRSGISPIDHIPLTWVKHTSGKGPVSQFVLDNLGSINYTLEYRPGPLHKDADAVSRFPCLGPKVLITEGKREDLKVLLQAIPRRTLQLLSFQVRLVFLEEIPISDYKEVCGFVLVVNNLDQTGKQTRLKFQVYL